MKKIAVIFLTLAIFTITGCAAMKLSQVKEKYSLTVQGSTENLILEPPSLKPMVDDVMKKVVKNLETKLKDDGFTIGNVPLVIKFNLNECSTKVFGPFGSKYVAKYTISVIDAKTSELVFSKENTDIEDSSLDLSKEMVKKLYEESWQGIHEAKIKETL
jgi:hypothetical protein